MLTQDNIKLAIIGLGYVGLPLAVEFGKHRQVIGFDINPVRIKALQQGHDSTLEVTSAELASATCLAFSSELDSLAGCNVFIVTVPTPVDEHKRPDLAPLIKASETIGKVLKPDDIVIYESTVYPGATEDDCVPVLERVSGLVFNQDFFAGYSPERINPGDKEHRVTNIKKVTSGSTPEIANLVDSLYQEIIQAGTHKASSIKVAEASKVIENTQRDINIAIVNEFAQIFNAMGIDTSDVLAAAGTKWNFLPFRPGLVGGHCISIDPYYLCHKSQSNGYIPDILIAGRRINDGMSRYVANQVMGLMISNRLHIKDGRVLILGASFKENCPDIRNSRVIDIVECFKDVGAHVDIHDPWVNNADMRHEYQLELVISPDYGLYDAIILAVAHQQFLDTGSALIRSHMKEGAVLYDIKSVLDRKYIDGRL
jgi:UDP-N-acetyl-D-glucosamine/UDP-N-acetyl-D-galactosamine dehydrogenase